jgi:meiotically up-regulated gene 157 (Mug157) protein
VGFRPSDNACGKFNVPVNGMITIAMRKTAELCRSVYGDAVLAALADELAQQIEDGIATHGTMVAPQKARGDAISLGDARSTNKSASLSNGTADPTDPADTDPPQRIYAYETDGLGNYSALDDANTPSLLSLPYFGFAGGWMGGAIYGRSSSRLWFPSRDVALVLSCVAACLAVSLRA